MAKEKKAWAPTKYETLVTRMMVFKNRRSFLKRTFCWPCPYEGQLCDLCPIRDELYNIRKRTEKAKKELETK